MNAATLLVAKVSHVTPNLVAPGSMRALVPDSGTRHAKFYARGRLSHVRCITATLGARDRLTMNGADSVVVSHVALTLATLWRDLSRQLAGGLRSRSRQDGPVA